MASSYAQLWSQIVFASLCPLSVRGRTVIAAIGLTISTAPKTILQNFTLYTAVYLSNYPREYLHGKSNLLHCIALPTFAININWPFLDKISFVKK